MSKIAYCSIQEAWGIEFDELMNPSKDNMEKAQQSAQEILQNNDVQPVNSTPTIDNNENLDSKEKEIKYLEQKIRILEKQYQELLKMKKLRNNTIETFQNSHGEQKSTFMDLIILVLIGIFIIYIIDNLVKIKK